MRPDRRSLVAACSAVVLAGLALVGAQGRGARPITWADAAPLQAQLEARGITPAAFPAYLEGLRQTHARRVREGDLNHLVFYWLQSQSFTPLPSIEPGLSAKMLVEGLDAQERAGFLRSPGAAHVQMPGAVRSRLAALLRALDSSVRDPRLAFFRSLVRATFPDRRGRDAGLTGEYLRVMRFVYEKEFVAQRSPRVAEAVAELYRTRGLSTDTEIEAGYVVYLGLGIVKSLDPNRRVRRVLVVGPGLDLAPRTSLLEVGPPQSYQPWAVIDALLALGLARIEDLEVVAADINPRVVEHLRAARAAPPTLTLVNGIRQTATVTLSAEFRDYFTGLGRSIGQVGGGPSAPPKADAGSNDSPAGAPGGHLQKTVVVSQAAAGALHAETLDVVAERLDGPAFDLIIATNILPYFDDGELILAMSNVAAMLAPGGVFLHNEARPSLQAVTSALGLPVQQSRHAIIAEVRGAPAPLFDSVWIHEKARPAGR